MLNAEPEPVEPEVPENENVWVWFAEMSDVVPLNVWVWSWDALPAVAVMPVAAFAVVPPVAPPMEPSEYTAALMPEFLVVSVACA